MPSGTHNPNIARIEDAGQLVIARPNGGKELVVPLHVVDGDESSAIDLFEGGVVWEDSPYHLSFEFRTTAPTRCATLSVNDHNELRTTQEHSKMMLGGTSVFAHAHEVDAQRGYFSRFPFALTCGFARVEVRVVFKDGPDVFLATPNIVSLDEPRKSGPSGDSAEEGNVGEMYRSLTRAEGNQAAEWMFANANALPAGKLLSSDNNTDWAYAPICLRLQVANDALNCVLNGLEDTSDAFPTALPQGLHPDRPNRRDTDENRAVRALVASMDDQVQRTRDALRRMYEESRALYKDLGRLVQRAGAIRGRSQSLPALQLIAYRVEREGELLSLADELQRRIANMQGLVDDPIDGFGKVGKVGFHVPEPVGVYAHDKTYAQLREAMRIWDLCASEPMERLDACLHAIKPDKLFEYSALHKMLDWLWRHGFVEDESWDKPIDRFEYSLADWYFKFENERRCANTFHLIREDVQGKADKTRIDLYYQPVLYLGEREENGIDLHRIPGEDGAKGNFWTPDYLLVVRRDGTEKTYLLDAKYCSKRTLGERMDKCFEKYVLQTARGQGQPGAGIAGVVLLAGRLDAPQLSVREKAVGERTLLQVVAPFNRHAGQRKMTQFFQALGIVR